MYLTPPTRPDAPPRKYLTRQQFATLKGRLTRAQKRGPGAVVREVRHAVEVFDEHVWPDDWSRWQRALTDCHRGLTFWTLDDVNNLDEAGLAALIARLEE